jgi:signal transduction histidine kinase
VKGHPSILKVLGWRLLLVSLVLLVLVVSLIQSRVETTAQTLFRQALEEEARSIAARLTIGVDGQPSMLQLGSPSDARTVIHYRVLDAAGRELFASPGLPSDLPPPQPLPSAAASAPDEDLPSIDFFSFGETRTGHRLMGATLTTRFMGKPLQVQVFEDLDARGVVIDDLVRDFFAKIGWVLVPFVVALFVVNILTIWAQLRPLTKLSRLAAEIGPETTGRRLPEDGQAREVLPLIRSINRALERLDHGFQVQRQFTADAAHELRTPLAVLSAQLDTLGESAPIAALRQEVAGMSRLVAQLLRIAQLDALGHGLSSRFDLHAVTVETASALAPLALKAGRSIAVVGSEGPIWARGEPEAIAQAVRNLVENAIAHTPRGTTVEIELGADRSVKVSDSGPGVPPALREQIFRRFWRADRRTEGAGLGLAIVAKVAETHGGTVHVEESAMGGAAFVLRLPPEPEGALADATAPEPLPAKPVRLKEAAR